MRQFGRTVAIVQARMSSNRLPGKVLRKVAGIPILGHLLARLEQCEDLDAVMVATSRQVLDDPIESYVSRYGVSCFRGSLDDVACRVAAAAGAARARHIVRVSGDSPLLDRDIVSRALALYRSQRPDLATNVQERTFPKGQSVEVFSLEALQRACADGMSEADKEHVTPAFYKHPERFVICNFRHDPSRGEVQLSVDTPEDLQKCERILGLLGPPYWKHGLADILKVYDGLHA